MKSPLFIDPDMGFAKMCNAKPLWKSGRFKPDQTFRIFAPMILSKAHLVSAAKEEGYLPPATGFPPLV
jgi:hypothetical protein